MKTRLALILSIGGVLTAGSAAALVNTQALSGASGDTPPPAAASATTALALPTVLEVPLTGGSATLPGEVAPVKLPGTLESAPSTVAGASAPNAASASNSRVFDVGESGVVTVDAGSGGALSLVSAVPASGWKVASAGSTSVTDVQVVFRSATVQVTFVAHLQGGEVTTSVSATGIPSASSGSATNAPPSGDDDGSEHSDDGGSDDGGSDD